MVGGKKRISLSGALQKLHWLRMEACITFKVLLLVFKILKGQCSQNLELRYKLFNGRPEHYLLLETPNFKTACGKRIFAYNGTLLWNALPVTVRSEDDANEYKKMIKTMLFDGHEDLEKKVFKYT